MYFDAVVDAEQKVLCNASPWGVRKWLIDNYAFVQKKADLMVIDGRTLFYYSVDEYLSE